MDRRNLPQIVFGLGQSRLGSARYTGIPFAHRFCYVFETCCPSEMDKAASVSNIGRPLNTQTADRRQQTGQGLYNWSHDRLVFAKLPPLFLAVSCVKIL